MAGKGLGEGPSFAPVVVDSASVYQLFHNYVRPHMALKGKTPSEAAGIKVEGENKWLTIIQNASKPTKPEFIHKTFMLLMM